MSRYIINEVETRHHLILIRLYFILTILTTEDDHNHIVFDWSHRIIFLFSIPCGVGSLLCMRNINCKPHSLAICCLSRIFFFFSIDSSEARKQYDEYCLSIIKIVNMMYKYERMLRYILNDVETSHNLILIRVYFILTILITEDDHNHICF
jgi:hypothetical protein